MYRGLLEGYLSEGDLKHKKSRLPSDVRIFEVAEEIEECAKFDKDFIIKINDLRISLIHSNEVAPKIPVPEYENKLVVVYDQLIDEYRELDFDLHQILNHPKYKSRVKDRFVSELDEAFNYPQFNESFIYVPFDVPFTGGIYIMDIMLSIDFDVTVELLRLHSETVMKVDEYAILEYPPSWLHQHNIVKNPHIEGALTKYTNFEYDNKTYYVGVSHTGASDPIFETPRGLPINIVNTAARLIDYIKLGNVVRYSSDSDVGYMGFKLPKKS